MRILAGQARPDSGTVVREKDTRVSYVPQSVAISAADPDSLPTPLWEEAEKAFERGAQLVRESAALEERLGTLSPESPDAEALLWKHHELQEKIEASGYHARAEGMHRVLTGLGFSTDDFSKACTEFSAGWQMRIAPRPGHPRGTGHPPPGRADQLPGPRGAHVAGGVSHRLRRGAAPRVPRPVFPRRRRDRGGRDLHDPRFRVHRQLLPLRRDAQP